MKKVIRLTESDLNNIIKESVNNAVQNVLDRLNKLNESSINEIGDTPMGQYQLGRLEKRQNNNGQQDDAFYTNQYASNKRLRMYGDEYTPQDREDYADKMTRANATGKVYGSNKNFNHSDVLANLNKYGTAEEPTSDKARVEKNFQKQKNKNSKIANRKSKIEKELGVNL